MNRFYSSTFLVLGNTRLSTTPTTAASPMPDIANEPDESTAPPRPIVSITDMMMTLRVVHVDLMLHKILHANACYRSEQQQHDAAEHGLWDRLQQCAELADDREADGCGSRNAYYGRRCHLGDGHGSGHFRVSSLGWSAKQCRCKAGTSVAEHGAMNARVFYEVLLGNGTYHVNVAYMLKHGGYCHGYHV